MLIRRPEDIGALVRDQRRQLGLSQTQLAAQVGTSQRYISHLENGKRTLQLGLVLRVLDELGVGLTIQPRSSEVTKQTGPKPDTKENKLPRISIDELVDGKRT